MILNARPKNRCSSDPAPPPASALAQVPIHLLEAIGRLQKIPAAPLAQNQFIETAHILPGEDLLGVAEAGHPGRLARPKNLPPHQVHPRLLAHRHLNHAIPPHQARPAQTHSFLLLRGGPLQRTGPTLLPLLPTEFNTHMLSVRFE